MMTTLDAPTGAYRAPMGIWRRAMRALGKLRKTVLALPEAPVRAADRKVPLEYYRFPPF